MSRTYNFKYGHSYERAMKRADEMNHRADTAFDAADHVADDGDVESADWLWQLGITYANDAYALTGEWEIIPNGRKRSIDMN